MNARPLLAVDGLSARHGRIQALEDVSLTVRPGGIVAVLGRNGAGKSTLMSAIVGAVRPTAGVVRWNDRDVTKWPTHRRVADGVALVPEGRRIFPHLTIEENLRLGAFRLASRQVPEALDRIFSLFPVLAERRGSPAGQLSGGQQQMVAIGRALISAPKLLLLDEPSLGLAPRVVHEVYERIGALRELDIAVVLVEQKVERALAIADYALVLHLGRVAAEGAPGVLRDDPRLMRAYTGDRAPRTPAQSVAKEGT